MTELPKGWVKKSLGEVCLSVQKVDPKDLGRNYFKYVDIGSLEPLSTSLANVSEVATMNAPGRARQLLAKGDSVFSTVRPYMKKVAYIPEQFHGEIASTGFCVLRPDSRIIDPLYLFYFLLSDDLLDQVLPLQRGVSYPAISDNDLKSADIPIPPIDQQHKIVEILEDHLSRLDAALAYVKQAKVKTVQFRRSLINQCTAGWIDDVNLRNKYDGMGRPQLAQGWKWTTIDEIVGGVRQNAAIGPFGSNLKVSDYRKTGVPLVFVRNIRTKVFAPIGQPRINAEKASSLAVHNVKFGDVLVTKMGDPPGDCAVYSLDSPGIITSDCLRLRPSRAFDANYLTMAISSSFVQQQIARISQGVAQQKMSLDRFRKYVEIPCPDLATQMRILKHSGQILESSEVNFSDNNSLERYAENLRRSLLQAAFTGQLTKDVTNV